MGQRKNRQRRVEVLRKLCYDTAQYKLSSWVHSQKAMIMKSIKKNPENHEKLFRCMKDILTYSFKKRIVFDLLNNRFDKMVTGIPKKSINNAIKLSEEDVERFNKLVDTIYEIDEKLFDEVNVSDSLFQIKIEDNKWNRQINRMLNEFNNTRH